MLEGERVLDSGTDLLPPLALADRIRAHRKPRMEALEAFLLAHPDHQEAQEARQALLRRRMPNPRLELKLMEEAQRTQRPFRGGPSGAPWAPLKALWEAPALRVLPQVEAHLRHWPESAKAWEAWLDWASVHPRRPSPVALLQSLAVWKSRFQWSPGPLPMTVCNLVCRRLTEEKE